MSRMSASQKRLLAGIAAGAAGGLAAAWTMSQFGRMSDLVERAWHGPPPDAENREGNEKKDLAAAKTARAVAHGLFRHELTEREVRWAAPAVQYVAGTAAGALYGGLSELASPARAGAGTVYGAGVWLVTHKMALPALGLNGAPRSKTPVTSQAKMLTANVVYGATTHLVRKLLLAAFRK